MGRLVRNLEMISFLKLSDKSFSLFQLQSGHSNEMLL